MNYPYYDLHSWSKHYREDVLQITQGHHLAIRTGVGYGKRRGRSHVGLAHRVVLSLLRSA